MRNSGVFIMINITKIIILGISLSFIILDGTNAVKAETGKSGKIIIYYFQDKSTEKKHQYYSYIIPHSIAKDLKRSGKYTIQTLPVTTPSLEKGTSGKKVQSHLQMLANRGKKLSADYIITGSYIVREKKIYINAQIFDIKTKKISRLSESSTELGTILIEIIDHLTKGINTELVRFKEYHQKIDYTMSKKEFYRLLSFSSYSLSAITIAVGVFHYNDKVNIANDNYDDLSDQYSKSTNYDEATRLHKEMEHQKELADEFALVRNILYGVGAVTFLSGVYFTYKYFKYRSEEKELKTSRSDTFFFTPLSCYRCTDTAKTNTDRNQFIGAMITWRF
jgi:TolB-like protein